MTDKNSKYAPPHISQKSSLFLSANVYRKSKRKQSICAWRISYILVKFNEA